MEKTPALLPLPFALRGALDHKGTRLGCGEGQCGACTVTVDGVVPLTSCTLPLSAIDGKRVGAVEGTLAGDHPLLQHSWSIRLSNVGIVYQVH